GALHDPFPPLPPLPPKSSSVTPAPAPVPSEPSLPGDNDDQQVVRSGSTNQPTSLQRSAPNSFPEMKPLPQVIPARADEPAQPSNDNKPMPMTLAPLDLPPGESIKPKNDDAKPMPPPTVIPGIELPGAERRARPKPNTPSSNGNGGVVVVPPPGPVIEPPPMPKAEPKPESLPLAPLPGAPMVNPPSVPGDAKPIDLPPAAPADAAKPMNPAKPHFPLP